LKDIANIVFCNFFAGRKLQSVEEFQELMASRAKKIKDICDHKGQGSRKSADNFKKICATPRKKSKKSQRLPPSTWF
jgi:hypothetical protein